MLLTNIRLLRHDIETLANEVRRLGVVIDDGWDPRDNTGLEVEGATDEEADNLSLTSNGGVESYFST